MGDNFTKKKLKVTPINSKVRQETFLTHNKYDTHVAVTGRVLRLQCQNSPYPSHLPLFKKFHEAGKIPKREDARISVLLEALNWTTPAHIEKSFGRIVRTMGE